MEKSSAELTASLSQATANAAAGAGPDQTLASLDAMLARAQTLKRKLEALHTEEQGIHRAQRARVQHLQDLHEIPSLADVKYDQWSKIRLDRMLVDHLLRQGYTESAQQLAKEKGIEDLVDVGEFIECGRIEDSLRRGETKDCLAWCAENKQALKKISSNLELELRLQQFVELVRAGDISKLIEATMHARKHLGSQQDIEYGMKAGGLLANPGYTNIEPYKVRMLVPKVIAHVLINHHSPCMPLPAGITSLRYSSGPITTFSRFHHDPSYTLPFQPDSQLSRHPPATPHSPAHLPTQDLLPPLYAPSAVPSSMNWPETYRTLITARATSKTIQSSCRMAVYTDERGCCC